MSLIIKAIHIYSHKGEVRSLPFKSSGLNIITGDSKTGKSAIIDIIDYCFGRSKCQVAEGVIRKSVSWFAVDLQNESNQLFIARKNPGPSVETSPEIYIRRGKYDAVPDIQSLEKNITQDALVRLVSRVSGISENENRPLTGTRGPLQATIRHALFLCFQKQDEIDNRERLFHRQGDQFIPQSIKDTVPYFLGAIDQVHFLKQNELDLAKDELRSLHVKLEQQASASSVSQSYLRRLINDGKRVGIIRQDFEPVDDKDTLTTLERASVIDVSSENFMPDFGEQANRLRDEQKNLRDLLSDNTEEIRAARLFLSDQNDYTHEGAEQKSRLISIGLYKHDDVSGVTCPVCLSTLDTPTPSVAVLSNALEELDNQLSAVQIENPHIQKHIEELERKKQSLQEGLVETQALLTRAVMEDEKAKAQQDMLIERARVVGRLSSYLDARRPAEGEVDYKSLIESAKMKVQALEAEVSAEDVAQKVDTYLNLISTKMSEYSRRLDLEHSGSVLRLDLKKLTVVADTEDGPIPLNRMGSGENWVGYHVLTHLALHWWLRRKKRPAPGFLIFDQPSQAHYPAERDRDGKLDPLDDKDRQAVYALFKLMNEACQEIGDGFQLIVLDHVHMKDDWFEAAILEEWRRGRSLVPADWVSNSEMFVNDEGAR